jgi:hypothetical protein
MAPANRDEILEDEIVRLREEQRKSLDALQMLFDLLEQYAPWWYTEEHRQRALSALEANAAASLSRTLCLPCK